MKTTRLLALAAAAAVSLSLFACGDDDTDGTADCTAPTSKHAAGRSGTVAMGTYGEVCKLTCAAGETGIKGDGVDYVDCAPAGATMGSCKFSPDNHLIVCSKEGQWLEEDCNEIDGEFSTKCPTTGINFTCKDDNGDDFYVYDDSFTEDDCDIITHYVL